MANKRNKSKTMSRLKVKRMAKERCSKMIRYKGLFVRRKITDEQYLHDYMPDKTHISYIKLEAVDLQSSASKTSTLPNDAALQDVPLSLISAPAPVVKSETTQYLRDDMSDKTDVSYIKLEAVDLQSSASKTSTLPNDAALQDVPLSLISAPAPVVKSETTQYLHDYTPDKTHVSYIKLEAVDLQSSASKTSTSPNDAALQDVPLSLLSAPAPVVKSETTQDTDESADAFIIEMDNKDNHFEPISGRRIIDINYHLRELQEKACHVNFQNKLYEKWEETASVTMEAAANKGKEIALAKGQTKNDYPVIEVYVDGAWCARS